MTRKRDYPKPYILNLLKHYDALLEGKWFETEDGELVRQLSFRAPFEAATIALSDIDKAIDSLGSPEREFIIKKYCSGNDPDDLLTSLDKRALNHLSNYLNGECVLYRWCRENGFVDASYHINIPEGLHPEVGQYLKDICTDFCVVHDCPR